jgi:hypothetical protein
VFANFSPGLRFGNPGKSDGSLFHRNPEGIATGLCTWGATLSGLRVQPKAFVIPGLPKHNPGLELANAFGVGFIVVPFLFWLTATFR